MITVKEWNVESLLATRFEKGNSMIRILIAEDFQLLRDDLRDTLNAQEDMTVVGEAATGAALVQLADATPFDLALVDIEMENTTAGIHAAETLLYAHPEGKVIFLTAHETENMILMSMGAGATDYVVKGCSDEELMRHIRSAMAGEPMLDVRIQQTVLKEYNRLRRSEKSLLFFINNVAQLTPAERTLVRYLIDGKKVREIAQLRCVEVVTVKTQIKSLLRKFGCARSKEIVELIEELNVGHLF